MPLIIVRNDIVNMRVDAIVNSTNTKLKSAGMGVDAYIHQAAGPQLQKACDEIGGCPVGSAVITPGFGLLAKYVIHTAGPVWQGGKKGEKDLLKSCYRSILSLAAEHKLTSIAVPIISAGAYGYPKREALDVASKEIRRFLQTNDEMTVYLVIYNSEMLAVSESLFNEITQYIDNNYIDMRLKSFESSFQTAEPQSLNSLIDEEDESEYLSAPISRSAERRSPFTRRIGALPSVHEDARAPEADAIPPKQAPSVFTAPKKQASVDFDGDFLKTIQLDESFNEAIMRIIDEKGIKKPAAVYTKANLTKAVFSNVRISAEMSFARRNGKKLSADEVKKMNYKPGKTTAVALCIALELDEDEFVRTLEKAGYALSQSVLFDVIIRFFVEKGSYDVFTINEMLFKYDQPLLG